MHKINLLPKELRKDPMVDIKRVLRTAIITTLIGVLALAYITLAANNYFKEKEIEAIQAEISSLEPTVQKVEALKKNIEINNRKISSYKNLLNQPIPWPDLLRDISYNMPVNLWLKEVSSSKVEQKVEKTEEKDKEPATITETYLTIKGYGPSLSTIGIFMLHLNTITSLDNVTLVVAKGEEVASEYILSFEIRAKVKNLREGGESNAQQTSP